MNEFLERTKAFFVQGNRDLINRIKIFSYHFQIRSVDKKIKERIRNLGRISWELGLAEGEAFPTTEELKKYEAVLKEKNENLAGLEKEMAQLHEQKEAHLAHYQKRLNEQLQLKRPVDDEMTDLLVEVKRMKKEIKGTQIEINTLKNKLEVQTTRLADLKKSNVESTKYLQSEIDSEIELNNRFLELKHENLELLRKNIDKCTKRAEKVKLVISQYDQQILEIRTSQKEMVGKDKDNIARLHEMKVNLQDQIKRIKGEMAPLLERLGGEVTTRRVQSRQLIDHYKKIDALETRKDLVKEKSDIRKKENDSIGWAIKAGFYSLLTIVTALIVIGIVAIF